MINEPPITPPPELVQQWANEWQTEEIDDCLLEHVTTRAAQWGANQELEACCEWFADDVVSEVVSVVAELRAARRPKPPSLKEQALERCNDYIDPDGIIRRALEALPND